MSVRILTGKVAKLSINDGSFLFYLGSDDDSFSVSTGHRNYNAMASALIVAAANNFEVTVKSETDGRAVSLLTIDT